MLQGHSQQKNSERPPQQPLRVRPTVRTRLHYHQQPVSTQPSPQADIAIDGGPMDVPEVRAMMLPQDASLAYSCALGFKLNDDFQ